MSASTLFGEDRAELSIGTLAERAEVAQATASREVARLAEHGLVTTRALGRNTLVRVNRDLPWAKDLRSILVQTVGPLGQLGTALAELDEVEEAFVFGSWAACFTGEPGPAPNDIDVLVIGCAALRTVRRACAPVERNLRVESAPMSVLGDGKMARAPKRA